MALPFRQESEEGDRVLALSDGVIAIAITLLVLEISVPAIPAGAPRSVLPGLLLEQWHEFLGFVLSFLIIGQYWVLHRRIFVHIETYEQGVVMLNLLFLLLIAFVPFAASLFTTYPDRFGAMFYGGIMASTGGSLALLWGYASRKSLIEEGLGSRTARIQATRFVVSPLVFALSILVAAVDPILAILAWLLLIPTNIVLQSRVVESIEESSQNPASRTR